MTDIPHVISASPICRRSETCPSATSSRFVPITLPTPVVKRRNPYRQRGGDFPSRCPKLDPLRVSAAGLSQASDLYVTAELSRVWLIAALNEGNIAVPDGKHRAGDLRGLSR